MPAAGDKVRTKAHIRPPRVYLYFDAVVSAGSIRKAAERLFIAPSALNKSILELEDQVGTPLFERLARGVRLTVAGDVFHEHVRKLLQNLNDTCRRIDNLGDLVNGSVRIAATGTIGSDALPPVIASFHEQYPGVSFDLAVASSDEAVERLVADEVDLAILFNPSITTHLEIHRRAVHDMCALVSMTHPLAQRSKVHFDECVQYPLAIPALGMGGRSLLDEMFATLAKNVSAVLVANSMEALKVFVRHSNGVTFLIETTSVNLESSGLTFVRLIERFSREIVIATRKGRPLSASGLAFLAHVSTTLNI